jgi:hypothetical protein
MEKIKFESVNEAVLYTTNTVDSERVYDVTANVRIDSTSVTSFDNGVVKTSDRVLCTFNAYSKGNLNTHFQGNLDITTMCNILNVIDSFIDNVENKVVNKNPIVLN